MTRLRIKRLDYAKLVVVHRDHATGLPCLYCWEPMESPTWDHVIPKSRGGPNSRDNCIVCCFDCNQTKDDRDLAEFAGHLYAIGSPIAQKVNRLISWLTRDWSDEDRQQMARVMAEGWVETQRQRTGRHAPSPVLNIPAGLTETMRRMIA